MCSADLGFSYCAGLGSGRDSFLLTDEYEAVFWIYAGHTVITEMFLLLWRKAFSAFRTALLVRGHNLAMCRNMDLVCEWHHIWYMKDSCGAECFVLLLLDLFCRNQFGFSCSDAEPNLMKFSQYFCVLLLFGFIYSLLAWKQNTGFVFRINCGLCSRTDLPSALSYKLERFKLREKIQYKWI